MNDISAKNILFEIVGRKLAELDGQTSFHRANKARIRKTIGKTASQAPKAWEFLYAGMSPEVLERKDFTKIELAVFTTLKIYVSHNRKVEKPHQAGLLNNNNVGKMLSNVRSLSGNQDNFNNKVTSLFSATDLSFIERKLIDYVTQSNVSLDYKKLSWELYLLQTSHQKNVLHRWGTDFYFQPEKKDD